MSDEEKRRSSLSYASPCGEAVWSRLCHGMDVTKVGSESALEAVVTRIVTQCADDVLLLCAVSEDDLPSTISLTVRRAMVQCLRSPLGGYPAHFDCQLLLSADLDGETTIFPDLADLGRFKLDQEMALLRHETALLQESTARNERKLEELWDKVEELQNWHAPSRPSSKDLTPVVRQRKKPARWRSAKSLRCLRWPLLSRSARVA